MNHSEETLASITSIKNEDGKVNAYIISIKKKDDIVEKLKKSRATAVSNKHNEISLLEK